MVGILENKIKHIVVAFICLLPIWHYSTLMFPDIYVLAILTIWCDLDIVFDKLITNINHRNWVFHSIIFPVLWLSWGSIVPMEFLMGFLFSVSVHLLFDIHFDLDWKHGRLVIDKIGGTYSCFHTYKSSTLWYAGNATLGFLISGLYFTGVIYG